MRWQAACVQGSVSIDGAETLECVWMKFTRDGNCLQMQLLHAEDQTMCLSTFAEHMRAVNYYCTVTLQKHA